MGVVLYREPLGDIVRDRVVGTVPDHGDRATAWWFLAVAPALWISGRLLRSAEATGDLAAQRAAGTALVAVGAVGAAVMPLSGFWGVIAVGTVTVRRSIRSDRCH